MINVSTVVDLFLWVFEPLLYDAPDKTQVANNTLKYIKKEIMFVLMLKCRIHLKVNKCADG